MTTLNRRAILTAGAAGMLGLAGVGQARAEGCTCAECDCTADFEKLALNAKTQDDFKNLAQFALKQKKAAEKRAAAFTKIAENYRKHRIPGATEGQTWDAARAIEHVAEHHGDVAEALEHLVETYEGLADPFVG